MAVFVVEFLSLIGEVVDKENFSRSVLCNIALIRQTNPEIKVSSCSSMTTLSFHVEMI